MTQNDQCQELLMQEVVRIDFMPVTALKVAAPFAVRNLTEIGVTMSNNDAITDAKLKAASLLSLNMNGDATVDAEMQQGASHKVTEKSELMGTVRTHTLQIPIESGFSTIRTKDAGLQEVDFHVILTDISGARYLLYAVPNACQFAVEETTAQNTAMNIKATLVSMSGPIRIQTS